MAITESSHRNNRTDINEKIDLEPFIRILKNPTDNPIPPNWQDDAECRDMDTSIFFPGRGEPSGPAKQVCRACDVAEFCLRAYLDQPNGIFGGVSENKRRILRRRFGVHVDLPRGIYE